MEATDQGGPICPMDLTFPMSMPISSVLEQNVAVGRPERSASSVSSRSPLESEPWWTRNRSGSPRLRASRRAKSAQASISDLRLAKIRAVLPWKAVKTSRARFSTHRVSSGSSLVFIGIGST